MAGKPSRQKIKNQKQYLITCGEVEKFQIALIQITGQEAADSVLRDLEIRALQSQLRDLKCLIREYERL